MRLIAWLKRRTWGLIVGGTVTLLVMVAHVGGWLAPAENLLVDLRFRRFASIEADPRIVMVDIDDFAVERIARWPWPRRLQARLINVLSELGARSIVLDIVLAEPQAPRFEHPALAADYDVDPSGVVLGEVTPDNAIYDDDELVAGMKRAGNVFLAVLFKWTGAPSKFPAASPSPLEALLRREFTLDTAALSERLEWSRAAIELQLAEAKRKVATELVGAYLREHPAAPFAEIHDRFNPGRSVDVDSPDKRDLLYAYRYVTAMSDLQGRLPAVDASLADFVPRVEGLTPPLDKFAKAARGFGFVVYERDRVDGVLRRVPLLAQYQGKLIPQLGFAAACDLLNIDPGGVRLESGETLALEDRSGQRRWHVPLDADARLLINWHRNSADPEPKGSFLHIAVGRFMEIEDARRRIQDNNERGRLTVARAVKLFRAGAQYAEYSGAVRLLKIIQQAQAKGSVDPSLAGEGVRLAALIRLIEHETLGMLKISAKDIKSAGSIPPERGSDEALALYLADQLLTGKLRRETDESNRRQRARIDQLRADLSPLVRGKVCVVGYTAAAVADMVNSPVFDQMPGVLAHANVLNNFLQGQFARTSPRWMGALLIMLAGGVMTALTSSRGPVVSLVAMVILLPVVLIVPLIVFAVSRVLWVMVGSAAAVFTSWAFITLYRQLTEQRQKRFVSKVLAQYTSPAIAREIVEQQGAIDFSPVGGEVTCFFSDLQGFTTVSERLGAARTRAVLNPYLEAMSDVLVQRHGMINKFIGDGIFAFFNAPIYECKDHARAACEAALDCMAALRDLKQTHASERLGGDFGELQMRIGVHTGEVFVGDYGSEKKMDYTCIGDTVNLAARLESANKVFGTRIMISGVTRLALGEGYVCRLLANLRVKGKLQAVPVYELVGRTGEMNDGQADYAARFSAAVACFARKEWEPALEAFAWCERQDPADPVISRYLADIDAYRRTAPGPEWQGEMELAEK